MQSRSPQKKSTIIPCVVVTSIQCCSRRKGRDEYQSGGSKQGQGTEGEGGATGVGREGPHRAESWKGKRSFSLVSATFLYTGLSACRLACTRRANVVRRRRRRISRKKVTFGRSGGWPRTRATSSSSSPTASMSASSTPFRRFW